MKYLKGHVRSAHGGVSHTEMFVRRTAEVGKQMDEDSRLSVGSEESEDLHRKLQMDKDSRLARV